jgi:DNA transformation protein
MLMFALIADSELYFKTDLETAKYFKSQGLEPFTYQAKGKLITLSYYKILPEIIEDNEIFIKYFNMAYNSALNLRKTCGKNFNIKILLANKYYSIYNTYVF